MMEKARRYNTKLTKKQKEELPAHLLRELTDMTDLQDQYLLKMVIEVTQENLEKEIATK